MAKLERANAELSRLASTDLHTVLRRAAVEHRDDLAWYLLDGMTDVERDHFVGLISETRGYALASRATIPKQPYIGVRLEDYE